MTRYFEIISTSAPHIYHSALVLTPRSSIVRELYEEHARPFTRVVWGVPASWDPAISAIRCPFTIKLAIWSPCNKYFAICASDPVTVVILDSTTLRELRTLKFSRKISSRPLALIFSPNGRMFTCCGCGLYSDDELVVVSWDLRTGRVVSAIEQRGQKTLFSGRPLITYSANGKMVGVLYRYHTSAVISIYDVVSGVYMHDVPHGVHTDHSLPGGLCFYGIWTHGESLRFATAELTTITVREVGFSANSTPAQVGTFSVPASVHHWEVFNQTLPDPSARAVFLPASHRLALIRSTESANQILIWNPRDPEPLLLETDSRFQFPVTVSSNGRFLACSTPEAEVCLWKESSAGYVLAAKLPSVTRYPSSFLSPNGQSIIVHDSSTIQVWDTNYSTTAAATATATTSSPSSVPTQSQQTEDFILEFHHVRPLAVIARRKSSTVTILDIKSGLLQLTINTGVEILGIRVTKDAVAVVGDREVVAWKLPEGNCLPGATLGVEDRAQTIYLTDKWQDSTIAASISFDLRYVAFVTRGILQEKQRLYVYSTSTGQRVGYALVEGNTLWFSPGGHELCCANGVKSEVWTVTQDGLCEATPAEAVYAGSWEHPWKSSRRGYQTTEDGWILGPDGKRLLMLPPLSRSGAVGHVWRGQYFALLHGALPEPIILELKP